MKIKYVYIVEGNKPKLLGEFLYGAANLIYYICDSGRIKRIDFDLIYLFESCTIGQ